jgi:hypothetical protein
MADEEFVRAAAEIRAICDIASEDQGLVHA